jgi:hypothetical protein
MEKRIKKILLVFIVGLFVLPLFQYYTNIVNVKELHGFYIKAENPSFSVNDWFTTNFQQKYDKYYNENFGFRSSFVRLHNQVDYSLFDEVHANGVIVGKQRYLYEEHYINSYFGQDYIGRDSIQNKINTLEAIYKDLKQHQTEMLIVIAPGKGFYYPEYIPDSLVREKDTTNYEVFIDVLKQKNIPYIDFNSLFLAMKDTSSIVLYPQTGIHWSMGILPYVIDSIIKKTESILKIDMPTILWERSKRNSQAYDVDTDIEKGLNMIRHMKSLPMNYPEYSFESAEHKTKPKAIAIADSFLWQIYNMKVFKNIFRGRFWYYYKKEYINGYAKPTSISSVSTKYEVYQSDIVILMSTESNLYKFPFGFENILKEGLPVISDSVFQVKVSTLINYIKTNKKWLQKIQIKAKNREISLDSMLYYDAAYLIEKKFKVE